MVALLSGVYGHLVLLAVLAVFLCEDVIAQTPIQDTEEKIVLNLLFRQKFAKQTHVQLTEDLVFGARGQYVLPRVDKDFSIAIETVTTHNRSMVGQIAVESLTKTRCVIMFLVLSMVNLVIGKSGEIVPQHVEEEPKYEHANVTILCPNMEVQTAAILSSRIENVIHFHAQ